MTGTTIPPQATDRTAATTPYRLKNTMIITSNNHMNLIRMKIPSH